MSARKSGEGAGGAESRPVVYCLIPAELGPKLHDLLRAHFRDDPAVEVVVERRSRERRRRRKERRVAQGEPPASGERRLVRSLHGRRLAERRAAVAEVEPLPLPRRARRYAAQLAFIRRQEPATRTAEDLDAARLVMRFQAGDEEAFATLYARYFDRVYSYLRVLIKDHHEAEDLTQDVFMRLFEKLGEYERREQPFWTWLVVVMRNTAISHLRKTSRLEPEDPATIQQRREQEAAYDEEDEELFALNWITDQDLLLFVERLSQVQRQVLLLRFMFDLPSAEVARLLGRSPEEVRKHQHRALNFLRDRLEAVGRAPERSDRPASWQRRLTQARSSRARKFALK